MKNKFLFTVIVTSLCLLVFIVKTFAQGEETFKVNRNGKLNIEISGGDIKVNSWDRNEVKVVYDDDSDKIRIKQTGNDIDVTSHDYLDFEITVPSEYNLNLNTSGGDISVLNNIKGIVKINTSGGDINIKTVSGDLSVNTAGGNIDCDNIQGDVKLTSSGGDIKVGTVEGECKLSTGGGNITVGNVSKNLSVSTGGGNVKSGNVGNDADIVTGGGNVSLDKVSGVSSVTTGGGNVSGTVGRGGKITTGAGDVNLKNLSGGIEITSGAGNVTAEFSSAGTKESEIITGYGNITVYIPANSKVTIETTVKLSEGNVWSVDKKEISEFIKSDFKSSNEDIRNDEYHAVYEINGGGTIITLQTSLGIIDIKKR